MAKSLTNQSIAAAATAATSHARSNTVRAAEGGTQATPAPTPAPPVDPAEAVRTFLTEMGYDTGRFRFESREEFVMFPGGGYTHRFTTVELPNGLKENFTTDLMARFPAVTANEIRRLMENQHLSV
jgi:hypothetical protein